MCLVKTLAVVAEVLVSHSISSISVNSEIPRDKVDQGKLTVNVLMIVISNVIRCLLSRVTSFLILVVHHRSYRFTTHLRNKIVNHRDTQFHFRLICIKLPAATYII